MNMETVEIALIEDNIDVSKVQWYLIVVSTPNKPGDMLTSNHRDNPEDKCIYKRIYLPYTIGAGDIFSQKRHRDCKEVNII